MGAVLAKLNRRMDGIRSRKKATLRSERGKEDCGKKTKGKLWTTLLTYGVLLRNYRNLTNVFYLAFSSHAWDTTCTSQLIPTVPAPHHDE